MGEQTTLLIARDRPDPIVQGASSVRVLRRGPWMLVADDLGTDSLSAARLQAVLREAASDPVEAVLRHFAAPSLEVFALFGPPGVIVGSAPNDPRQRIAVSADHAAGVAGVTVGAVRIPNDWICLRAGSAICWGPDGPEAACYMTRGNADVWAPYEHRVAS
jgi:hypothetical protein